MRVCPRCKLRYHDALQLRCLVDGATLEDIADPRIGQTLAGRYEVESSLGHGGMGTVYRALHLFARRYVAIKILHDRLASDPSVRRRFERESRATAQIAHPNIIEIFESGTTNDDVPFIVMEYLVGDPLDELLKAKQRLPIDEVVEIGLQAARGLARAHDVGVVHRDIKPPNIFICKSDDAHRVVKVVDFGIAVSETDKRLTNTGQVIGSPQYMAPERFMTQSASPATDLYSFGITLFQLLAGELPFQSASMAGYLVHHLETEPPSIKARRPDVPAALDDLIRWLMEKEPEKRPRDMHAVVQVLTPLVSDDARRVRKATVARIDEGTAGQSERLDLWAGRAMTFEAMLDVSWPRGDTPPEITDLLADFHATIGRLRQLRRESRSHNERLQQLDASSRESRERLGRALHVIGQDLSRARGEDHDSLPPEGYKGGVEREFIRAEFHTRAERPSEEGLSVMRRLVYAYSRWLESYSTTAIDDLTFQLESLRKQLKTNEEDSIRLHKQIEGQLSSINGERSRLELRMVAAYRRFTDVLRPRPELAHLFAELDREVA